MMAEYEFIGKATYFPKQKVLAIGDMHLGHEFTFRDTGSFIPATQLIETNIAQDKVIIGVTSKDLLELGWPKQKEGSLKSIMASYLTGILIGKLAKEKRIESAIFDIGMNRNVSKSRVFALLKGAIDSGMKIPYNPDSLPTEEDLLKNQNLKGLFKLKEKIQGSSNK